MLVGIAWFLTRDIAHIQHSGDLVIEPGMTATAIGQQLQSQGFTSSTLGWKFFAWRSGAAEHIQAGTYHLEQGESVRTVLDRLATGQGIPTDVVLTFPEGFTFEQIADRTAKQGIGTMETFQAAAQPSAFAASYPYLTGISAGRNLEGYLFPDTYRVFPDDTSSDVVRRLVGNFDQKVYQPLSQDIQQSGRTLDQIVIMASIIEREVTSDSDMARVAGILWKRFDEGMGLDADATIRYVVKKWDGPLTVADLATDSAYNTRRYRGLPPGPISNPGLRALTAAIHPEPSEYYYYLSTSDGHTVFARTNDEHNLNKAKYLH